MLEMPTCFWVLDGGLGSPWPRLDVASLLQGEDEAAVADDRTLGQPLQETLSRHCVALLRLSGDLAVGGTDAGGKKKRTLD